MTKRDLDGVYFRVQRGGKWVNRCWTDLTKEEQAQVSEDCPAEWWKAMAENLGACLRALGDELDVACRKGDE